MLNHDRRLFRLAICLPLVLAGMLALAGTAQAQVLVSNIDNDLRNIMVTLDDGSNWASLVQPFRTGDSDELLGNVKIRVGSPDGMFSIAAKLYEQTDPEFGFYFAPDFASEDGTVVPVSDLVFEGSVSLGAMEVVGVDTDLYEITLSPAAGTVLKAGTIYYLRLQQDGLVLPIALNEDISEAKGTGWRLGTVLGYNDSDMYSFITGQAPVLMQLNAESVEEAEEDTPDDMEVDAEPFPELSRPLSSLSRTLSEMAGQAVSERIDALGSGNPHAVSLGGSAGIARALASRASSLRDGTFDMARFLSGSSFSTGERGSSSFWGAGSYRSLSDDAGAARWDGDVLGGHLGVDTRLYADVRAGLMVSVYEADLDYVQDAGDARGRYSVRMTSLNPYAAWRLASGAQLWGTFGTGDGTAAVEAEGAAQESDLSQRSLTLGFRGLEQDLVMPGATLTVKGDATVSHGETAPTEALEGLSVSTRRLRLLAEGRHARVLSEVSRTDTTLEMGFRQDSGDGESGTGIELGGGVAYRSRGLSLTGRVRTMLSDGSQANEWGLSGSVAWDARPASELGFALSLAPAWGVMKPGAAVALWNRDGADPAGPVSVPGGRLSLDMGYGFAVFGGRYAGIPHAGVALRESGRDWRLGYRLSTLRDGGFEAGLAGRRHERDGDREPAHAIEFSGRLSW